MFKISFNIEKEIIMPDEYNLGWLCIEHNDKKLNSIELSGRGLMMIFFSVTSLLECLIKLNSNINKPIRFVGEDSSFILYFKRNKKNEIKIIQNKKVWAKINFQEFFNAIWSLSESLFHEYGKQFEEHNIAFKDWVETRKEVVSIFHIDSG